MFVGRTLMKLTPPPIWHKLWNPLRECAWSPRDVGRWWSISRSVTRCWSRGRAEGSDCKWSDSCSLPRKDPKGSLQPPVIQQLQR